MNSNYSNFYGFNKLKKLLSRPKKTAFDWRAIGQSYQSKAFIGF